MSPFDFINQINHGKKNLIDETPNVEKEYTSFIINRGLSFNHDTALYANEMNVQNHLDPKLQFDFLLNTLRTRQRYTPWLKAKKEKHLESVKEYYGYSNEKAKSALNILNDEQINTIMDRLNKGGRNGK